MQRRLRSVRYVISLSIISTYNDKIIVAMDSYLFVKFASCNFLTIMKLNLETLSDLSL